MWCRSFFVVGCGKYTLSTASPNFSGLGAGDWECCVRKKEPESARFDAGGVMPCCLTGWRFNPKLASGSFLHNKVWGLVMAEVKKGPIEVKDIDWAEDLSDLATDVVKGGLDRSRPAAGLLFDEADALFGKRTNVKDST